MKIESGFPGERAIHLSQPFIDLIADDPLTGDLYIHSLGHIAHARHHSINLPRGCEQYTFIYCTWGKGRVTTKSDSFCVTANQFVVLPCNVALTYAADEFDPWSFYWVRFSGDKAKIYAKRMSEPRSALPSIYSRLEQRIDLFESAYAVLCGTPTISRLNYANICFSHFIASFDFTEQFQASQSAQTHVEGMVNRVTHYLNENLENRLTIKDMAQYAGYSESYFYRQFIKQTDTSPMDYFIKLKINKASIYLLKTSMSIAQIASKLGFNSPDYFSRTFTRIVGISASEFRKQNFRL